MKKWIIVVILIITLAVPVNAAEFTAPEVPDSGAAYMPENAESFGEGLWFVLKTALFAISPEIKRASGVCICIIGISLLISIISNLSSISKRTSELTSAVGIGLLLLQPTRALINLGASAVTEISEYGKMLIPVMTSIMAAQGGVTASTALYTGTMVFSNLLTNLLANVIIPMIYVFLCLCIANSALGENLLKKLRDLVKWAMTWSLKIILYVFTGYISITGVVSGSADSSMVKATKLAISGSVPVVGGILSDASEAILVSATVMKNAAGTYGVLAIAAIFISPFLKIGIQCLLLKLTAAICGVFAPKRVSDLIQDFSVAMGYILACISTISLLLLIATVCFMKGVS